VLDLFAKAIAYSSGIAIGAAAITLIYISTRTFNFAHASMVAWGFYMMFTLTYLVGGSPYYYLPIAALFSSFLGVITYVTVNRRLLRSKASETTLMMSTLGVDLIFYGFLNVFADFLVNPPYRLPAKYFVLEVKDFTISGFRGIGLIAPILVIAIVGGLQLFFTRSKLGIAMRATIENPDLAGVLGINPEFIYLLAWLIGGALAGLAGGILSLVMTGYTAVGMTIIVSFFAGAIVGGLYSVLGSLLGGFLIGLGEYVGSYLLAMYVGGWIMAYRPVIPLVIMASTLLIYPQGLAGLASKILAGGGKK